MPRYFITTSDGFQAHDDEGLVLPDIDALATMLRQTLATMLRDEGGQGSSNEFWADASDETGRCVLTAKVTLLSVQL